MTAIDDDRLWVEQRPQHSHSSSTEACETTIESPQPVHTEISISTAMTTMVAAGAVWVVEEGSSSSWLIVGGARLAGEQTRGRRCVMMMIAPARQSAAEEREGVPGQQQAAAGRAADGRALGQGNNPPTDHR